MTRRDFFLRAIAIAAAALMYSVERSGEILPVPVFAGWTHGSARRDPAQTRVPWEKGRYLADLMLHCPQFPLA